MKFVAFTPILASVLLLQAPATLAAGELDPAHLPADAKWVLHVDFEALADTALVQHVRENRSQLTQAIRRWFQDQYGIDPRQDLKGATVFSDTYQAHTGTVILQAAYDVDKVESELKSEPHVQTSQWQDLTLYTVSKHRKPQADNDAAQDDDLSQQDDRSSTDKPQASKPQASTATVVLVDESTVVFASSPERAKAAVKLLAGESPSLEGASSALTAEVPQGAFLYGAAIELQDIDQHEGLFPILRQHERIVWALGEQDEEMFEQTTMVAQSAEVAEHMETVMHGLVAFQKVWAADSQPLLQLTEQVEISRDGATLQAQWRSDTQTVIAALQEVAGRFKQWRQGWRH